DSDLDYLEREQQKTAKPEGAISFMREIFPRKPYDPHSRSKSVEADKMTVEQLWGSGQVRPADDCASKEKMTVKPPFPSPRTYIVERDAGDKVDDEEEIGGFEKPFCFKWPPCQIVDEKVMVVAAKKQFSKPPTLIFFEHQKGIPLEYNDTCIPVSEKGIRIMLHVYDEYKHWIEEILKENEKAVRSGKMSISVSDLVPHVVGRPVDVVLEKDIRLPPAIHAEGSETKPLLQGSSGSVTLGSFCSARYGLTPMVSLTFKSFQQENASLSSKSMETRKLAMHGQSFIFLVQSAMPFLAFSNQLLDEVGVQISKFYL
ncbi:MAG: hypothetical protein H7836_17720, partial [Magnetococcus sp. YQC-3]